MKSTGSVNAYPKYEHVAFNTFEQWLLEHAVYDQSALSQEKPNSGFTPAFEEYCGQRLAHEHRYYGTQNISPSTPIDTLDRKALRDRLHGPHRPTVVVIPAEAASAWRAEASKLGEEGLGLLNIHYMITDSSDMNAQERSQSISNNATEFME